MKTAEGYDAWSDVQQRILSQENSRASPEQMAMTLVENDVQLPTPDYGQITLMVVEHEKKFLQEQIIRVKIFVTEF